MLYIDGISLNRLKDELESSLTGKRLGKIYQYSKFSISLFFGKNNLFFTVNPNLPIVYLADSKDEAPHSPMNFSLNLRKYLLNATLYRIEQEGYERILYFHFEKINELGEQKRFKLIFEIMGRHSNIFLVDEDNRILDSIKKSYLEESGSRVLMSGAEYLLPPVEKKENPRSITSDWFEREIKSKQDVIKKIEGFGKLSSAAVTSYDAFIDFIEKKSSPVVYLEDNKIRLGAAFHFPSFETHEKLELSTINSMINYYVDKTLSSEQINSLKNELYKTVEREIKRNKKIIKQLERDIEKNSSFGRYKELGDILAANLYSIKSKQENAVLFDFYNNEDIVLKLDPTLSPKQNLDAYYKRYNKAKRGYEFNFDRMEFIEKELQYLDSIKTFLDGARDLDTLNSIKEELVDGRYLRSFSKSKKRKKPKIGISKVVSQEGYEIYFGKNNRENEYITFKMGGKDDLWLHAKDVPGSHVLIKNRGDGFSHGVVEEAAAIAAKNSKLKNEDKVFVDYTLKKFVKKPSGSKPGFVIYTHEKGIVVKV